MSGRVCEFGVFRLLLDSERLFVGEAEVQLGHRAMRLLALLVERRGDIVRHSELMAHVWPETVVEDNNLRVQITSIRRVLREHEPDSSYIKNIAGRGYRFVREELHALRSVESHRSALDSSKEFSVSNSRGRGVLPVSSRTRRGRHTSLVRQVREGAIRHSQRDMVAGKPGRRSVHAPVLRQKEHPAVKNDAAPWLLIFILVHRAIPRQEPVIENRMGQYGMSMGQVQPRQTEECEPTLQLELESI
ncbi:winged helix-turn-helix domain-containing protein [Paraburkholderia sp. DHOC27]|uniref:winged helix-turn-helix domain-containing protein n=1 Tax=Paraburkholderia sp. DHOC27 TaxID=2303330 RepID=UPI0015F30CBD|nr:winged helix-turn-helix domain-containing protein [Paraburkholderia sp. DHOC27]